MNRYKTLIDLVREIKPNHVLEIGTWNGKRAAEFMAVSNCYYTGFDLFEEASKETDEKEFNVKRHFELVEVAKQLDVMGFSKYQLIRGNTNETLKKAEMLPFDFAFIDGGHSEETIKNDYGWVVNNIEPGGTIILDDWYSPAKEGMGCNFIKGEVIGPKDPIMGGGSVQLLRVQANG